MKSVAFVPPTATSGEPERVSADVPVFWIVKVRTTVPLVTSALPKSVWSVVAGDVSPSAIETALPTTLISTRLEGPRVTSFEYPLSFPSVS